MTFRFQCGDEVMLKDGERHAWFLPAGSRGTVFCQYATTPPAYEVNFRDVKGEEFGSVVYEDEVEPVRERAAPPGRKAVTVA